MMNAATNLIQPHQRALGDLLDAERTLREKNEIVLREMRQVLLETAIRLDGERLETLRRSDPSIPANWTAADWKQFFSRVPSPSKGWGSSAVDIEKLRQDFEQQLAALQMQLHQVQEELIAERSKPVVLVPAMPTAPAPAQSEGLLPVPRPAVSMPTASLPPDVTPAFATLINDVKAVVQSFPKNPPASFSKVLTGGGRNGGDLTRAFQRYWIALYLIGHWRLAAAMELEEIVAAVANVSAGSGSLRRILDDLVEAGMLASDTLRLETPRTALKIHRLTPDGERLYQAVFGKRPVENEWARLNRLHEGERFPDHTVAVIALGMHARKRGWAVQVLPEVKGSNSMPDLLVSRGDDRLHVEVELGNKERVSKWRNQAGINGGKTALCFSTPDARTRIVGECKSNALSGVATDLETLVKVKFANVNVETPFWIETW